MKFNRTAAVMLTGLNDRSKSPGNNNNNKNNDL